jgi:hypothetical protein
MGGIPKSLSGIPFFAVDEAGDGGVAFTFGLDRGDRERTKTCTAEEAIDVAVEIIRVARASLVRMVTR